MISLRKYLKPFIFPIILALVLLFAQAICDLELPNLMSEIVNVGIQSSGVENVSPEIISENGLEFVTTFMSDNEKEIVYKNYTKLEKASDKLKRKYENINKESYVLIENIKEDELTKLDYAFEIAIRTFLNTASSYAENGGENTSSPMDLSKLYETAKVFANTNLDELEKNRKSAEIVDEATIKQTALVFTKMFYQEVGIDIENMQTNYIFVTGAKMLGISIIILAIARTVNYMAAIVSRKLNKNLTKAVFEKIMTFSDSEFDKFLTSSLITRTTNDIVQVQNVVFMIIRVIAYAPIMGIGGVIMILQRNSNMSWILALACIAIICLIGFVFIFAVPKFKILQKLTDKINLVSREMLSGTMVARAFGTQKHEEKRFDEVNTEIYKTDLFVNRIMIGMFPVMTLIMNAVQIIIVWVGAHQIAESNLMVGDMMAFIQYSMQVIMSFLMFSGIFIMLPRASVSGKRIEEVLKTEPKIKDAEKIIEFNKEKIGYVEFKNVSFAYEGAEENAIEDISFIAKPGETTAFIGATGAGKSTLIKLIPRFYDVTKGEVLVNGVNVKNIKQESLQEQIGYVPQTAMLLTGTISSNLKYGMPNTTDEIMENAAKIAQATEFIEQKEDKFESEISQSGKNVSGGQKQRLSIARALVKQAPIYIFDDSFSALDFKTDSKLRKALKEYNKNSTVIIVAQRVSSIMHAEQIIVLEDGKIVGKGTHKELLKNCPTYYEIAASQLKKEEL